jgi:hypothetical protein
MAPDSLMKVRDSAIIQTEGDSVQRDIEKDVDSDITVHEVMQGKKYISLFFIQSIS